MSKNELSKERQLISRIHRLEGQVRALERVLGMGEQEQILIQFEAVIAASKSALNNYVEIVIQDESIPLTERQKVLARLLK